MRYFHPVFGMPAISSLRAFEAAARLGGFKAASAELNLTPSAISHQIRNLEQQLGRRLFERNPGGIRLTGDGRAYLDDVSPALDGLRDATRRLMGQDGASRLAIRTTPAFAIRWLLPRLSRFLDHRPELDLRISTGLPPTDFERFDVDVWIHWGTRRCRARTSSRSWPRRARRCAARTSPDADGWTG